MAILNGTEWEFRRKVPLLYVSRLAFPAVAYCFFIGVWSNPLSPVFSFEMGIAGSSLILIGFLIRAWATTHLSTFVMASKTTDTQTLVTSGPYAISRNPNYLGTMIICAGFGLFYGWIFTAVFLVFHWFRNERVIRYEEAMLRHHWGSEFDIYCRQVNRWFSITRLFRVGGIRITWSGFLSNVMFFGFVVGSFVATAMGEMLWLVPFEAAGYIAVGVVYRFLSRSDGDAAHAGSGAEPAHNSSAS